MPKTEEQRREEWGKKSTVRDGDESGRERGTAMKRTRKGE